MRASHVTQKAQFEYAWCLVRSKYSADIRKGILLLEDLYNNYDTEKRDCLYYLAIGNARIKVNMVIMSEYVWYCSHNILNLFVHSLVSFQEYSKALSYVRSFLQIEPANVQVQQLETLIKKKMEKGFPFIIYYRLKRIKIKLCLGAISLRSFCDFLMQSYYFWLLLIIFLFSWIAKFYIYST